MRRVIVADRALCGGFGCPVRSECGRYLDAVQVQERGPRHRTQRWMAPNTTGPRCPHKTEA